jgi:Mg/Co/Ni transporter MgtE
MLYVTAMFIFFAAGNEAAQVKEEEALQNLKVSDAMMTDFRTLSGLQTLHDAVDALLASSQQDYPVLDGSGSLLGILSRRRLVQALRDLGPQAILAQAVEASQLSFTADQDLAPAMAEMKRLGLSAMPVSTAQKPLAGLLTTENVMELLLVKQALQ